MTTAKTKIQNILIYLIPSLISNLLPFISLPIITRFLTPSDYGLIALVSATMSMIVSFFVFNIDYATQRYYFEYRENKEKVKSLLTTTLLSISIIFLVLSPIIFFSSKLISQIVVNNGNYGLLIFIFFLSSSLNSLTNYILIMYRMMERSIDYTKLTTSNIILNFILTISFVAFFNMGYHGLALASLVSNAVIFSFAILKFVSEFYGQFRYDFLIDNLKFGLPLTPNFLTSFIYQFFDKYMLNYLVSLSAVGFYGIAQNISSKLFVFMTAVQATFDPIFMKNIFSKDPDSNKRVGRDFTVFTYISLSVVLLAILFSEEMIYILTPKSYRGAIIPLIILLLMVSLQTFGKIVGSQLAYAKKAYLSFPITFVGMLVNVGLNLVFIPIFAATGAAFATLCTTAVMNSFFVIISQRYYKIIYEKRNLLLIYCDVFLAGMLVILFRHFGINIGLKYLVKILFLLFYFYIGVKSKIITKEKFFSIFPLIGYNKQY